MECIAPVDVVTFSDLTFGDVFSFSMRSGSGFALKTAMKRHPADSPLSTCVTLSNVSANYPVASELQPGVASQLGMVLRHTNLRFKPSLDPADLIFDRPQLRQGLALLKGKEIHLVAADAAQIFTCDVRTGDTVFPGGAPAIATRRWSIVEVTPLGEREICSHTVDP